MANTRLTRPVADEFVQTLSSEALDAFRKSGEPAKLAGQYCVEASFTNTGRNAKLMLSALKNATGTGKAHTRSGGGGNSNGSSPQPMTDLSPSKNPHPPKFESLTELDISNLMWAYDMINRGDYGSAKELMKRQLYATGKYKGPKKVSRKTND